LKRKIIVIIFIALIATGSFFTFKWWFDGRTVNAWALIPNNALFIIETSKPIQDFETAREKSFWPLVAHTEFGKKLQDRTTHLQKILNASGDFTSLFSEKKLLISMHVSSKKSCDLLFVAPLASSSDREILSNIIEKYKANGNLRFDTREYENFEINEFTDKFTKVTFSYLIHKNFLVGSFTGYLVEDAIRTIKQGDKASLASIEKESIVKEKINSSGNLYINYKELPKLTAYLFDEKSLPNINFAADLAKTSVLAYSFTPTELEFKGYSTLNTAKQINFLNIFKWQTPQKPTIKSLISNKTANLYFWGFENGKNLKTSLSEYWISNNIPVAWLNTNNAYKVDISNFYNWFGKQIALTGLETERNNIQDKLLFIQAKDVIRAKEELNRLNISANGSIINIASTPGLEIKKLNISEFPQQLLGNHFNGFKDCYYASIQDYIVISNHQDNIKDAYNDYVTENVWSKNALYNTALEDKSGTSNLVMFFNAGKSYASIAPKLNQLRKNETKDIEKQFKSFEYVSFKYSNIGDKFSTNITAKYQTQQIVMNQADTSSTSSDSVAVEELAKPVKDIAIGGLLNQRIWSPININENNSDYFTLDAQYNLHCFNKNHEKVFSTPIGGPINGEIYALDVNHFAFATNNKIHLIDIKGQPFKAYPKALPNNGTIKNINVFDYEHNRNYRIFVSDMSGNLFLFDKTGACPPTWKPMVFNARFKKPIQHITIGGKDCLYLLEENGTFHVFNRKGEPYPGFPIKLNSRCTSNIAIEKGKTFDQTLFRIITDNGEFHMINLAGKTIQKQQLIRTSKDCLFNIVTDNKNGQWVITRSEKARISFIDHNLQDLFSANINHTNVNYYFFSGEKTFYLIHSATEGLAYLFDKTGSLMDKKAFSSTGIPLLNEAYDEINIYLPQMNTLSIKKF
jgi:hypothetical protein